MGVLFRRGPTAWVQLIRWNLADDTFQPGQWFRGRVYEKRADLSPDGTKLLYFAQKLTGHVHEDYTYAWTAVSRPPYFTALALWPKGDCWNGGGLFESNTRLWLNHFGYQSQPHPRHPPQGLEVSCTVDTRGEDHTVLDKRMARDGWRRLQEWKGRFIESEFALAYKALQEQGLSSEELLAESQRRQLYLLSTQAGYVTDTPEVWEKPGLAPRFTLVLRKALQDFKYRHEFSVRDANSGDSWPLEAAEWAEWDGHGRLVYVAHGKVFAAEPGERGAWSPRELADFNAHTPEPTPSPAWARAW